jgi:hypothetical protein
MVVIWYDRGSIAAERDRDRDQAEGSRFKVNQAR